jgi:hypothetical protein
MAEQNRRIAASATSEHVIDPELMDAIRAEARATGPASLADPRSPVRRVADAARAAAAASAPAAERRTVPRL